MMFLKDLYTPMIQSKMMKSLSLILFVCALQMGYAQEVSSTLDPLEAQINEQIEEIEELKKTVKAQSDELRKLQGQSDQQKAALDNLSDSFHNSVVGIFVLGFSLLGLSGYAIYQVAVGIRKRVEQESKDKVEVKLKELAPGVVEKELARHPVMIEYARIKAIKQNSILIVSAKGKDADFMKFLAKLEYNNPGNKNLAIKDILDPDFSINLDEFKLLLFNNEDGQMTQEQMDEVTKKFGKGIHYFYLQGYGDRWNNKEVRMKGFATTRHRLDNNLIDALN